MTRDAILLLLMLVLVVSVTDATESPTTIVVYEPLNFVLSQTEMPIYETIAPEVNLTYAEDLAFSLFGIRDSFAAEVEGIYVVNSGDKTFELDSTDGSLFYADYSKLWNISLGIDRTTPSQCRTNADEWLAENELIPTSAHFANIGNTTAMIYNTDSGETQSKILQYHVNYEFTIGEYPITGEAAQISVMIGEGGERIGFDWKWQYINPDPHATAILLEFESILDTNEIASSSIVDYRLVYDLADEDSNLLVPVYEITLVEPDDDGNDIHFVLKIDATDYKPLVQITNPQSSITVEPGQTITFDCAVVLGTPPYTYEWQSDFDGVLSTAKSFSISTLSEQFKKNVNVPHSISVSVWDAENRWDSEAIAVTVDSSPPIIIEWGIVLVALGAVFVLVSALVISKRKGIFMLLFLLMLGSAFVFFPITSATSGMSENHKLTPSAPTGAYDDGVKEIGIEWIGLSHHKKPLYNNEKNTEGFYNWMGISGGYSREFNWHEYSAWEEDFVDASFGGTDTEWVDAVDFVYLHSHGGPNGISFTSKHDQTFLNFSEMRLGDGDLETLAIDACKTLAWRDKHGNNVFSRWGPAMQGIHQVCGFATNSVNSAKTGPKFGLYITGLSLLNSATIVNAWFRACLETEPSDSVSAVFYATKSTNPYQPQQDDPIHDHAYGFGYVCSDPTPGTYLNFVYITSSC
ncbi:hypothetical protein EU527_15280 [Candidatus Thorarchaeota archaeon]|nr:MAG: hypothetical protein EU527_15280 [Candidatus Thorarchaeota archaeon]